MQYDACAQKNHGAERAPPKQETLEQQDPFQRPAQNPDLSFMLLRVETHFNHFPRHQ